MKIREKLRLLIEMERRNQRRIRDHTSPTHKKDSEKTTEAKAYITHARHKK